jgi:hypothetical protein
MEKNTEIMFKIGDMILIARNSHNGEDETRYDYFDKYVGKTAMITKYNGINEDGIACWYTDIDLRSGKLSVCESDIELA